jgi:hypothetical protein
VNKISALTVFVVPQDLLKLGEVAVLMSNRDGTHALDFSQLCVLGCELDGQKRRNVLGLKSGNTVGSQYMGNSEFCIT